MSQKDRLPDQELIHHELYQEPIQSETQAPPLERTVRGITYTIVPLHSYELYGLVVSYTNCLSWTDYYHQEAKDFINPKDICVIYGENLRNGVYKVMKFNSDAWVCFFTCKKGFEKEMSSKFRGSCLANNHLLFADEEINNLIMKVRKGDQVHLKGYLVKYTRKGIEGWRVSSISRYDQGCEVIFVTDFVIIARANVFWNIIFTLAKYIIIGCIIFLLILFIKAPVYNS